MGKLFAAKLMVSGERATLLDHREDRARRLHENGLLLTEPAGDRRVDVYADHRVECFPVPTHVLICVKHHQTHDTLARLKPWFRPETAVVLLQNGLPDVPTLSRLISPSPFAFGVTTEGALSLADDHVKHTGTGTTYLGWIGSGPSEPLNDLGRALGKAGFNTQVVRDIARYAWSKLLVNAGINAPATILRLSNGGLLHPSHWGQVELAVKEGLAVMAAKGLTPAWPALAYTKKVCEMTKDNLNSMLQDLQSRKPTEIDAINGCLVREGAALFVPTPVNAAFTTMIHALEKQGHKPKTTEL